MLKRILSLCVVALASCAMVAAQNPTDVCPTDPDLRVGTLPSGATYYVRANKKDPQRANFHIVYRVGSVQEDDNQNGLAHFLEHMAFNGSKNFQDDALIDYLQTIGVKFGENLNAGTAQQMTTYMITNVPIAREGVVDTLLLALRDWAGNITLADKEIDKERGVIREEWRQYQTGSWRVMEQEMPVKFGNSLFAKRNVIGNEDVLKSFSYQDIKDFYHKWYRPDMQAFIVIGDFDADKMVEKLKAVTADMKPFDVQTPKDKITLPYNEEPVVAVIADKELTGNSLSVSIRHKGLAHKYNNTYMAGKNGLIDYYFALMINERLSEIAMQNDPPFMSAGARHGAFGDMFGYPIDGYAAITANVSAKDNGLPRAYEALLVELAKVERGGFTEGEFERAKAKVLARNESEFNNRNDRRNTTFVNEIEWSFLFNTALSSAEDDYELTKKMVEQTSLEEVNATAKSWFNPKGWNVIAKQVEKEGNTPMTNQQLIASIDKVAAMEIELPKEEVASKPLISQELKGSAVVKTEKGEFDSQIWTLKNGVRIIFRPSQLKANELTLHGSRLGGKSVIADLGELYTANMYPQIMQMAGVSEFSTTELGKMLAGKIASCTPFIGGSTNGYDASCAPKDAETMFQLLYLRAAAPRFDTISYNAMMTQMRSMVGNMKTNPDFIIQDSLSTTLYGGNPRDAFFSMEMLDMITLQNAEKIHDHLFNSANGMTFFITGNMEADSLKPLVEKYIGSLPIGKAKAKRGDLYSIPVKGEVKAEFKTPMQTPKVTAYTVYSGEWKNSPKRAIEMQMLNDILDIRYTKSIREEAGGTYGVGTRMSVNSVIGRFTQMMMFGTDDSKVQELLPIIQKEIDDLMANGPKAEDLGKVKENYKKKYQENINGNGYWLNTLIDMYVWDEDNHTNYEKNVESVTVEDLKQVAKDVFSQGNVCTVVQLSAPAVK